jgi:hypothetical protein
MITEQMYDRILTDKLLIAVLTFHNPNVFYEIAIAEAAARPLILLIERGHQIPFDIKDRRIIQYDLKPRTLKNDIFVEILARAIIDLEAASSEPRVSFRPSLQPLGAGEANWRVLARSEEFAPRDRIALVEEANTTLWYQGLALFSFAKIVGYTEAIKSALRRGVEVRVLMMHPDNPALAHVLRDFAAHYVDSIRNEIRGGAEFWNRLAAEGRLNVRYLKEKALFGALQMNDAQLVLTPYSLNRSTSDSPSIVVPEAAPLYQTTREDFDWSWSQATPEL